MPDPVEDALRELHAATAEPEPAQAEPEAEAQPPQQPQKIRVTNLDDIIIEDPRLPKTLIGQPGSALFEDRTRGWQEAQQAGYQKNRAETERDLAFQQLERAIERLTPKPPEVKPITGVARMVQRGVEPNSLFNDPDRFSAATIDAAADEAIDRFTPQFVPKLTDAEARIKVLEQREEAREKVAVLSSYRDAYRTAKPPDMSDDQWNRFAGIASAYVLQANKPLDKPESYAEAHKWAKDNADILGVSSPPPPVPAQPTAPPPPVGAGRPAVPEQKTSKAMSKLNNHQRESAARIVGIYAKQGISITADEVLEDMKKSPRTENVFP